MYISKIKTLEEQLDTQTKKYKELRTRRNLEVEGYKKDIENIRKKTKVYDEYLHRVKKLIDENPAQAIELAKQNILDVEPIKEQLQNMESKIGNSKQDYDDKNLIGNDKGGKMISEKENSIQT